MLPVLHIGLGECGNFFLQVVHRLLAKCCIEWSVDNVCQTAGILNYKCKQLFETSLGKKMVIATNEELEQKQMMHKMSELFFVCECQIKWPWKNPVMHGGLH